MVKPKTISERLDAMPADISLAYRCAREAIRKAREAGNENDKARFVKLARAFRRDAWQLMDDCRLLVARLYFLKGEAISAQGYAHHASATAMHHLNDAIDLPEPQRSTSMYLAARWQQYAEGDGRAARRCLFSMIGDGRHDVD
jgi:hypothetical protein